QVEALVGLIAQRWKKGQHRFAVTLGDRVVEVPILALERCLLGAGGVQINARSPQQLDVDTGLLGGAGHARRLLDRILERSFSHYERAASISMTMVFRSVICSSAKCPPTRSEERRVGKECRSRRAANGSKDNR